MVDAGEGGVAVGCPGTACAPAKLPAIAANHIAAIHLDAAEPLGVAGAQPRGSRDFLPLCIPSAASLLALPATSTGARNENLLTSDSVSSTR